MPETHAEDVLTMSCVKVEMSAVELSGRLIARRPSFGWRITSNVMTLCEELLKSFVTASKSSLVRVVADPEKKRDGIKWMIKRLPILIFLVCPNKLLCSWMSPLKFPHQTLTS